MPLRMGRFCLMALERGEVLLLCSCGNTVCLNVLRWCRTRRSVGSTMAFLSDMILVTRIGTTAATVKVLGGGSRSMLQVCAPLVCQNRAHFVSTEQGSYCDARHLQLERVYCIYMAVCFMCRSSATRQHCRLHSVRINSQHVEKARCESPLYGCCLFKKTNL